MIALFLAIVCAIELFRRLPVIASFRRMAKTSNRTSRMLRRKRVSEHWKERCMQMLSRRMFTDSMRGGLMLALVAAPIALVILLDQPLGLGTVDTLFALWPRIYLAIAVISYAILRTWVGRQLRRR